MSKLTAFLIRDFRVMLSYRFKLILQLGGFGIAVLFFFFLGRTFEGSFSSALARYGNDYFAFALLGMAVSTFVSTGLYSLSSQIRGAQVQGTLESLLMTPVSVYLILAGNSLWSFLQSFGESFLYLGAACFVLKILPDPIQLLGVLAVLALTFGAFLSLGMISAAFILVFKQGNPINVIFGVSSYFLGGLLFPTDILPGFLQNASSILPITHASRLLREILLVSPGDRILLDGFVYLAVFTAVVGPLSLLGFNYALKRAKKEGSLVQY